MSQDAATGTVPAPKENASPRPDPSAKVEPNRNLLCTICGKRACSET